MNWLKHNWGWIIVILIGFLPLIGILQMISLDFSGSAETWFTMDSFTVQGRAPGELSREVSGAQMAVKETGEWAIRWIVIILSLTPFSILTGKKPSLSVRQAAGITAFVYAFLHLLFFIIDKGLMETFKEVGSVLGLIATLIMLALAVTSNKRSMKFLRKNWKKLHRFAYLAGILAVLHVALLDQGDWIPYFIILVIGFLLRTNIFRQSILKFKTRKNPDPVLV
ncbi:MAG TPA: ferric reductase-like transmembrane domain-containing protein [Prolixibacteraceae bacterium]|nr:ferric reductase-like transmembrane domain-containing protein [Prolixibacteraceae bacterium]